MSNPLSLVFWITAAFASWSFGEYGKCGESKWFDVMVCKPFERLYTKGPEVKVPWLGSFGFWAGLPDHEICSRTITASVDWLHFANSGRCRMAIHSYVESWIVALSFSAYTMSILMTIYSVYKIASPSSSSDKVLKSFVMVPCSGSKIHPSSAKVKYLRT